MYYNIYFMNFHFFKKFAQVNFKPLTKRAIQKNIQIQNNYALMYLIRIN
jgi:hypothetical protein